MSTLDTVRVRARQLSRQVLGRPLGYLSAEWERMPAREKRSVTILGIAIVLVAASLAIYLVFSSISDLEQSNADVREALAAITKNRDGFLEAKARAAAQEARLGSDPPQLVADIEAAAREESMQIAESNERPPTAASKRWIEHDVDLKVREVDLKTLTSFLKRVETGKRPIFFTHLSLKRRFSEQDKLDAELTAVAFERVKDKAAPKRKGDDGSANAGGASGRAARAAAAKENR
jgi:type II secretory pathway component PulM